MDAALLARAQFALTIAFHFVFPSITIGLARDATSRRSARTGSRSGSAAPSDPIFAITFAVGVATGITMEFQFGTNWAAYSRFVGGIFGAPLAAEGIFAFFLESASWASCFGRHRSRGSGSRAFIVAFGARVLGGSGSWCELLT
jgi:cytochrome d ubiquinol oxidase subunit I